MATSTFVFPAQTTHLTFRHVHPSNCLSDISFGMNSGVSPNSTCLKPNCLTYFPNALFHPFLISGTVLTIQLAHQETSRFLTPHLWKLYPAQTQILSINIGCWFYTHSQIPLPLVLYHHYHLDHATPYLYHSRFLFYACPSCTIASIFHRYSKFLAFCRYPSSGIRTYFVE